MRRSRARQRRIDLWSGGHRRTRGEAWNLGLAGAPRGLARADCATASPLPAIPPPPNDAYTEYTYNDRIWLTSLENRKGDTLISSYAYTHDDVGNRTSMTEANGDVTSYTYDSVYRLTDETKRDSGNNLLYRYQYTHSLFAQGRLYDGVGNRLTETNTGQITYTHSLFAQSLP